MTTLRTAWAGWKRFAHKVGVVQTIVLVWLFYWLIVPVFSLIRFGNPLRLRPNRPGSFWISRKPRAHSLEEVRRQF